jgi:hypothetical protein
MKFILLILSFFALNLVEAQEISIENQQLIFDAITESVAFEDEGLVRVPQKLSDFNFVIVDESLIEVVGQSFSQWDDKMLQYHCLVEVLTQKEIQSTQDLKVNCKVENENWPYIN